MKNLVFVNGIMDAGKSTVVRQLQARCAAAYQLVLMTDDTPRTAAFYRAMGLSRMEPVSYTHLDVYKRQNM